jgi:hypothetical protein
MAVSFFLPHDPAFGPSRLTQPQAGLIMVISELIRIATLAPSADNSQPWVFQQHGDVLECSYGTSGRFQDPFGPSGHASLLAAGALHENLSLVTGDRIEVISDWLSPVRPWTLQLALSEVPDELAVEASHRIEARHTNRHPFKPILSAEIPKIEPQGSSRIISCLDHSSIAPLASALRICSQARFNQPDLHNWLFSSLRWNQAEIDSGDGLDINTLHLPPGGQHLMQWIKPWSRMATLNRLGLDYIMSVADTALFSQAPAVLAICGGRSKQDTWDAGRTLQRQWISLNAAGFAVHPYYAVTDLGNRRRDGLLQPGWDAHVEKAETISGEALGLKADEQLHILLRVGFPGNITPVRSRRRPPNSFIDQDACAP